MNHYKIVKEVIDDWDPKQFLHQTPEDEYNPEIRYIVELLPTATSVEKLAVVIREVFIEKLDEVYSIDTCYPIALKIWNNVNNSQFLKNESEQNRYY
ncbi:DUF1871 family protein [Lysinibacillus sp. Bpr_S20]|uniref:DUF1871 family protein n=1 Tax=Lysinibacillus sp. Bpr_S20 TaxID=2933964 RepID=UPI002011E58C|nr:DUF1871 family protein [Lysinibacillus sp. Bpr_S20]MCL1700156.1 DUF1871 family protein [Lysinibacillus sp. Bpr_S20]